MLTIHPLIHLYYVKMPPKRYRQSTISFPSKRSRYNTRASSKTNVNRARYSSRLRRSRRTRYPIRRYRRRITRRRPKTASFAHRVLNVTSKLNRLTDDSSQYFNQQSGSLLTHFPLPTHTQTEHVAVQNRVETESVQGDASKKSYYLESNTHTHTWLNGHAGRVNCVFYHYVA